MNTEKKRIFWIGDSTVQTNHFTTYPQTGIGQTFSLFVNDSVEIKNYARNGRSTKSFIDEGRFKIVERTLGKGDFLFIQFGHNDEKKTDPARFTEPFGEFQKNLAYFIDTARKKEAYPVLITPLYRRHFDENNKLKDNIHLNYPDAVIDLSKKLNVICIDLCEISRQFLAKTGDRDSKRYFMNFEKGIFDNYPDGKTDDTHLTYEGAVKFSSMIAKELEKLGGIYKDLLFKQGDEDLIFELSC